MFLSLDKFFWKKLVWRHVVKNVDVFPKNLIDWNDVHMYTFAKNIIATYSAMRIYGELTFFQLITLGVYNSSTRFRPSGGHYFL